jgi:hypothetical protein
MFQKDIIKKIYFIYLQDHKKLSIKIMKNLFLLIGAVALTATLFTGCSKDDDTEAPVVTLSGANPYIITAIGDSYVEPGYSSTDNEDGNITTGVVVDDSELNEDSAGTYEIHYTSTDAAGNVADVHREVIVKNTLETTVYKGIYTISEVCGGPASNYGDTLSYSNAINGRIFFKRFANYLNGRVYADINISSGTVNIPTQSVVCGAAPAPTRQFSGSGTISTVSGITSMSITYTEVTNGTTTTCTGSYTK